MPLAHATTAAMPDGDEAPRRERHRTARIARTGSAADGRLVKARSARRHDVEFPRDRTRDSTATPATTTRTGRTGTSRPSRRIALGLAVIAVGLAAWTGWLGGVLPARHVEERWNVAWIGFDAFLTVCVGSTAWLAWRRSPWISLSACATAVALLVDAWFDCLTAGTHQEYVGSVAMALLAELPLAAILFWIAVIAARRSFRPAEPCLPIGGRTT
jgi:hypothetical protein